MSSTDRSSSPSSTVGSYFRPKLPSMANVSGVHCFTQQPGSSDVNWKKKHWCVRDSILHLASNCQIRKLLPILWQRKRNVPIPAECWTVEVWAFDGHRHQTTTFEGTGEKIRRGPVINKQNLANHDVAFDKLKKVVGAWLPFHYNLLCHKLIILPRPNPSKLRGLDLMSAAWTCWAGRMPQIPGPKYRQLCRLFL